MRVFVTSYAVTPGIYKIVEVEVVAGPNHSGKVVVNLIGTEQTIDNSNWFKTFDVALLRANEMRAELLADLREMIADIEAIDYTSNRTSIPNV